jgi:hypothetical protein
MKNISIIGVIILAISLISCSYTPSEVKRVLDLAENNRSELEKVINHYKQNGDKEKLKAAYFLIANMQDKYGRSGEIINYYYPVFYKLRDLYNKKTDKDTIEKIISLTWDSLEIENGPITIKNYPYCYDYNAITADFLIENIDMAFKAWKEKPWAKHIDFNQFCEFILPYRIYDEPLQNYRKNFYEKFAWVEDSLKDKSDPVEACILLNNYLAKNFIFCDKLDRCPVLGVNDMYKINAGICEHRYLLVTSIMRSIGLPIAIDFTPQWNFGAGKHSWLSLIDKNGKARPFNGGEPDISFSTKTVPPMGQESATKVYRNTITSNPGSIINKSKPIYVPKVFQNAHIVDVTREYEYPQLNLQFNLSVPPPDNIKYVFLCCFGYTFDLIPTAYTQISSKTAEFKNVGTKCVYLPGYFNGNSYVIANNPCYVNKNGYLKLLNPDLQNRNTIKLLRKYPPQQFLFRMCDYAQWMVGAKLQASNDREFKNPVTLFTIDTSYFAFEEKEINNTKAYRYYRYMSTEDNAVRLAEVDFEVPEFKNILNKSKKFKIYGIANTDSLNPDPVLNNAFDGNIATNLNAPAGSWVAIDYGKPVNVPKIRFLVRNDLNIIEIGDVYELYYFDFGWQSLGSKRADKNYIVYDSVPDNALLLLRDLTKGKEERIFIYQNNKQEWL